MDSIYRSKGQDGLECDPTQWVLTAGTNDGGTPQAGDTAIVTAGSVQVPIDAMLSANTIEIGGTSGPAALTFSGDAAIGVTSPTVDGAILIGSEVPGQSGAEMTAVYADGWFVNQGTILADGPSGSDFTIAVSDSTINGTFQPGYAFNTGLIQADAGNTLTINIGTSSELLDTGLIVADGGTVQIFASASAIAGGYAPVRGLVVIEGGGTVETNVAYASSISGTLPWYEFADSTPGNTLKIDTVA